MHCEHTVVIVHEGRELCVKDHGCDLGRGSALDDITAIDNTLNAKALKSTDDVVADSEWRRNQAGDSGNIIPIT
jgi:hypothetical protein